MSQPANDGDSRVGDKYQRLSTEPSRMERVTTCSEFHSICQEQEEEERRNANVLAKGTTNTGVEMEKKDTTPNRLELSRTVSITASMSRSQEALFVLVVCLAQWWTQFGLSVVISDLHIVGASFDITDPGLLSWLIAGYSLTVGTFILITGRLGDMFGYKLMLLTGFSWFAFWSMVAGVAVYSNKILFIFARVLQGIGPSMTLPNGLAILGHAYPPGPRKAMAFSIFAAAAPTGSIFGFVIGALFGELSDWSWSFYFLAIALVATTILGYFVIPNGFQRLPPRTSFRETLLDMDALGGTLGVLALVLFNFAWNQAPIDGWQRPYIIVTLILGVLLFCVFFWYEKHRATSPLLPLDQLGGDVGAVLSCIACGWACFGIWWYYIIQFFQVIRGATPLQSAAWVSPLSISGALAAFTTGKVLHRVGPPAVMIMALTAFTVGTILIMTAPVDQTYWAQTFVCVLIMPWGMDMSFPAGTLILSNAVPKHKQGIAASLVNTFVNYSISLGLGFAGTVQVHVDSGGLTSTDTLKGYRGALYMGVALGGLGMFASAMYWIKCYRKDKMESCLKNDAEAPT